MTNWEGLWSYVHKDDAADGGRISQLARNVVDQFEMLTGETINLFLDKDAIQWGEEWRDKIDESLSSIAFFIPILTPRYFKSAECRRELNFFARRVTNLGVRELVLPLLYVDVPTIHEDTVGDELIVMIRTFQWKDWRDIRFLDPSSEGYRRGVAELAARLVEANRKAEEVTLAASALAVAQPTGADHAPGLLDRLAKMEEVLPKWTETIQAITADVEQIGNDVRSAISDLQRTDTLGKGFAGRLMTMRRLASRLSPIAERVWSRSNEFADQLHDVDEGFRALIEHAPAEIEADLSSRAVLCEFFNTVRQLAANAEKGLQSTQGMIDAIQPVEPMSRDLRPPLRRLREGLTILVEAREVMDEWVRLIDASGVDCSGLDAGRGGL